MNPQPLQILVHKADILISKDKEVLINLAYVVIDMLVGVNTLPETWASLRRLAEGVTKRSSPRGIAQFKLAYLSAVKEYQFLNPTKEEPDKVIHNYSERQASFEYRVANPSYFIRDTSAAPSIEVETAGEIPIIIEDSTCFRGREDEFQHRLRNPGRFRRSD